MTIHHDKMAYGKLANMREDVSDESLIRMAQALSQPKEEKASAFDFKKEYRSLYLPKTTPSFIDVPPMPYFIVEGKGDPNTSKVYQEAIEILYGLSFTVKMSKKKGEQPTGYFDYVVPPLEGFWWREGGGVITEAQNKDDFCWLSCIRQPDFVTEEVFQWAKEALSKKRGSFSARYEVLHEGLCVQALHVGSYDDEPRTIEALRAFMDAEGYRYDPTRLHHEIYLSDPRRCAPEKLKTVIRLPVIKK
jgi:hypothetical protein